MMLKKGLFSILLILFMFSCKEAATESEGIVSDGSNAEIVADSNAEPDLLIESVNTYHGLFIYKEPGKDYVASLSAGEVLSSTGKVEQDSKNRDYLEVIKANGEKGWAFKSYIVENAKPGVITLTKDLTVFEENNDNSISAIDMAPFRVLAVDTKLVDDTFSKVSWNKKDTYTVYKDKFVLTDEVSFNKDDIEFAKIMTAYLKETKRDVKDELLKNAKELMTISSEYRNYLNRLEMDDSLPFVPAVNSIILEYEDSITIDGDNDSLELSKESKGLKKLEDFKFELLNYILLNVEYRESDIIIRLYNTSNFNFTTIPGEITLFNDNAKYYLGVLAGVTIPSKDVVSIRLKGEIPEEDVATLEAGFKVGIEFINDNKISSHDVKLDEGV